MITESQIENVAKMKHSGKTRVENNQEVPALCPDVPGSRGNSLEAFLILKTQKNKAVPPCSPFNQTKEHINVDRKKTNISIIRTCIYNNNRGQRGNKREHGDFGLKTRVDEHQRGNTLDSGLKTAIQGGTKTTLDPRFRSQKFKDAVHACLDFLGCEHTMSEFRRLDSQLNWIELAQNLSGQRYTGPEYDLEIVARDFSGKI